MEAGPRHLRLFYLAVVLAAGVASVALVMVGIIEVVGAIR